MRSSRRRLLFWGTALNISLALGALLLFVVQFRKGTTWRADFTAFYTGAAIVRDGRAAELYNYDLQREYQQAILGGRSFQDGLLPYVNPPHVALTFAPLAWLSLDGAYLVWAAIQLALLAWAMLLLRRIAVGWSSGERGLLAATVLAFPPLFYSFLLGSFSLLILICLLQIYLTLKRGRESTTGSWLALGMVKQQLMLLPGVMLLVGLRWRVIAAAAAWFSFFVLLVTLLFHVEIWPSYIAVLRTYAAKPLGVYPETMYNLKGMLWVLFGAEHEPLIDPLSIALWLLSTLLTGWLWWRRWQPQAPDFELRFGLTILMTIFFCTHLNPQDGILLILPAVLFACHLRAHGRPLLPYAVACALAPLAFWLGEFMLGTALGVRIPILAMLLLGAWMLKALREQPRRGAEPGELAPGSHLHG